MILWLWLRLGGMEMVIGSFERMDFGLSDVWLGFCV